MTDPERDAVANFMRAMSLKIEEKTYGISTDAETATGDLLEIASWLCEAADALEALNIGFPFDARSDGLVTKTEPETQEKEQPPKLSPKFH